jgi:biotin carboxyl carrier protein
MLLAIVPAAMAQAPLASVQACRTESDEMERLKCYDREVDRIQAAQLPIPSSTDSNTSPPQRRPRTAGGPVSSFSAKITTLRFREGGEFIAALDNGQVWTQFVSEGRARIRVGDTVRIRPLLFGSFLLVGPSDWSTKVHQVQDGAP